MADRVKATGQEPVYAYRAATPEELDRRWDRNIADNPGDARWVAWKRQFIKDNRAGRCKTFVVLCGGEPVGEGTLLFSPDCGAIRGRTQLADGAGVANLNALRIEKAHEGRGHISKLVRVMERYAAGAGYRAMTIGVEAREARNLAIYLHWGYDVFVRFDVEDEDLVLYYSKLLG